jgi:hypothetical protein
MIIPTIPMLSIQFEVSAGGAAEIVKAFAIGKFIGTVVAGIRRCRSECFLLFPE